MKNVKNYMPLILFISTIVIGVLLYSGESDKVEELVSTHVVETDSVQIDLSKINTMLEHLNTELLRITHNQNIFSETMKDIKNRKTDDSDKKIETAITLPDANLTQYSISQEKSEQVERAEAKEYARVLRQRYDEELTNEAIDPNWSLSTETKIDAIFDKYGSDTTSLVSKQCRTNLCKVELVLQDRSALEEFNENFAFAIDWDFELNMQILDENNDSVTAVMYLSREGQSLPTLSNN